jgi:hypothetical protein
MDRTVPRTGSEEIELYIRTYYSLLRTSGEIKIRTLEEVHANMSSSLHPDAKSEHVDMNALIYCALRLPLQIIHTELIILGQSGNVFAGGGYPDVDHWEPAMAKARKRRGYYDGRGTLAFYVASRSDIDDIIPLLTAVQIEWNKLHRLIRGEQVRHFLASRPTDDESLSVIAQGIGVSHADLEQLRNIWGIDLWDVLEEISSRRLNLRVNLLASSFNDYRKATQHWWQQVERSDPSVVGQPVYFVSSNPHSMVNLITGFALSKQPELTAFLEKPEHQDLMEEWKDIEARNVPSSRENFLYYALKKLLASDEGRLIAKQRKKVESQTGVVRVRSGECFEIEAQIIHLAGIDPETIDPRLVRDDLYLLQESNALIINIDYPLGMAAYQILSFLAARVKQIHGIYILGKAATLNGVIGDVMLPSVVHDEQSQNTYLFDNCFSAANIVDDLVYGTVLDNQKAVTVRGTFLQNPSYMDVFYREGYTDIEMEAGPYLSAVYELYRPQRYPKDELVDLHGLPFDLGILHYASDTPLSKGKNLGAGSLSYFGMDPTYAASLTVLRRIFELEIQRILQSDRFSKPQPIPAEQE